MPESPVEREPVGGEGSGTAETLGQSARPRPGGGPCPVVV